MVNIQEAIRKFPKRQAGANKGDLGHVLVIAGSFGYTGAAYLASQAAMLSGSGLVTLAAAKGIYDIMASKLTEVIVKPFFETRDGSLSLMAERDLLALSDKCDCIAIGPGLSRNKETTELVKSLVSKIAKPMVIDADGINAFAGHPELLKSAKAPTVLTPHPGEMARLTGKEVSEIQAARKDVATFFAAEYNTVLALKGSNTVVADQKGNVYVNQTVNAGMASGGTGDVLTGMIASFEIGRASCRERV